MSGLVSLCDILQYVGVGVRPIKEGEQVFQAGHIILCGKTTTTTSNVVALCLQTSSLSGKPHKIDIILSPDHQNWKCTCTCKAGAGAKCKHVVAVLLHLNRTVELPEVSCTELEQAWGKQKGADKSVEVIPLEQFCHVGSSSDKQFTVESNFLDDFFEKCIEAVPNSEVARHLRGRNTGMQIDDEMQMLHVTDTVGDALRNHFLMKWSIPFSPISLEPRVLQFYKQKIIVTLNDALDMAQNTIDQNANNLWHSQRKLRITSSKCYELFTYCSNSNPDWEKKINSIINCNFMGNIATKHGNEQESNAAIAYETAKGCKIMKCGLTINPVVPWLGCSPDGLILEEHSIKKIVEIKCPFKGAVVSIHDLINSKEIKFLNCAGEILELKKKHKYYGQVQLCMGLLQVKQCDLVIYSSVNDDFVVVEVPFDNDFFVNLINKLHFVYFTHYLTQLCKLFLK